MASRRLALLLYLRENGAQAFVEHQVRMVIIGRFIPVDENQAVSPIITDQTRCRVHRQTGTGNDEKVCPVDGGDALFDDILVKPLFIENHIGLHRAAAAAFWYPLGFCDKFRAVEFSAAGTIIA